MAADVVWFDFVDLRRAAQPVGLRRDRADFHTVLVSRVPRFDAASDNQARRFIALVDELYDRNVKLVVSAAAPPGELYRGERLQFEFERTPQPAGGDAVARLSGEAAQGLIDYNCKHCRRIPPRACHAHTPRALPSLPSILSNVVSTPIAVAYRQRFDLSIPEWRVLAVLSRYPGLAAREVAERT